MGKDSESGSGLNAAQRSSARMEVAGMMAIDIAKELGVSNPTISNWRTKPEYRAHVDHMQREEDRVTVRQIRKVRGKALEAVSKGVGLMSVHLSKEDLSTHEISTLTKACLDAFKTFAAQTGISEVTKSEVSVSRPEEALALLNDRLGSMGDNELDALADEE